MAFAGPILLVILSNFFYHIVQKVTPQDVHPILSLMVSYLGALLLCVVLLVVSPPKEGFRQAFRQMNWTSIVLAVTILGIEAGYLLAYRSGWSLNISALVVTVTVTILLIPTGVLLFSEKLSAHRVIGIVVCIAGLLLLNWKS